MNAPTATEKRLATELQQPTGKQQGAPTTEPKNADGNSTSVKFFEVGKQTIKQIIDNLSKPIKPEHLKKKKAGGTDITFLPWYNAIKYLDHFAPGWSYEVRNIAHIGTNACVVVRITIPTIDGDVYREATGIEDDDKDGYGDPMSNAESMALRRAAAKFGLGLYLYQKK